MNRDYSELEKLKKMSVRQLLDHFYEQWIDEQVTILQNQRKNTIKGHEVKKKDELNFDNLTTEKKETINSKYETMIQEEKDKCEQAINKLKNTDPDQAFATKNILENKYGIVIQGQYPKPVFEKVKKFLHWYNLRDLDSNGCVATNENYVALYESYHPIDKARQFERSEKKYFWSALAWFVVSFALLSMFTFTWIPQWCKSGDVSDTWTYIWVFVSILVILIGPFYHGAYTYFKKWRITVPALSLGDELFAKKYTHSALKNSLLYDSNSRGKTTRILFPYSSKKAENGRQMVHDHKKAVHIYAHESSFEMIDFPLIKVPTQELVKSWHPLYYLESSTEWIYFYGGLDDSLQLGVKEFLITGLENVYSEKTLAEKASKEKVNGKFDPQIQLINTTLNTLTEIVNTKWNNNTPQANHKLVSTCSHMSIIFQYLLRNVIRAITIEYNASTRTGEEKVVKKYTELQTSILEKNASILNNLLDLELSIDEIHHYDKEKEGKIVTLFEQFLQSNTIITSEKQLSEDIDHLDAVSGSKMELKNLLLQSLEEE